MLETTTITLEQYNCLTGRKGAWTGGPLTVIAKDWSYVQIHPNLFPPLVPTWFENIELIIEKRQEESLPFLAFKLLLNRCPNLQRIDHPNLKMCGELCVKACPQFRYRGFEDLHHLNTDNILAGGLPLTAGEVVLRPEKDSPLRNCPIKADTYRCENLRHCGVLHCLHPDSIGVNIDGSYWSTLQVLDTIWRCSPKEVLQHFVAEHVLNAINTENACAEDAVFPSTLKARIVATIQHIVRTRGQKTR